MFVGHILTFTFLEIEPYHAGDRVDTESVKMVHLQPIKCIGDQERADLRLTEIEA
ncbi:hypothetical protein D3C81_2003360 [compost metagenome]